MTESHRRWHARIWLVLAPLLLAGIVAGVLMREPRPIQPPLTGQEAVP